ncbi:MAG TPA: MFS transporter [Opitutaceae bacterium]
MACALGFLLAGYLIDRIGTRRGYSISIGVWSVAGSAHGLVHSVMGLSVARFVFGLGEAGNFPSAIKSVQTLAPRLDPVQLRD